MSSSSPPKPISVLFVCLGNICRSTMSEGVFASLAASSPSTTKSLITTIDSCGTGAYHIGSSPDSRTLSTLAKNGITDYRHKARKFNPATDFDEFEYILAMDDANLEDLRELRTRVVKKKGGEEGVGRVMLFGEFGGEMRGKRGEEVDDPYYGGKEGFDVAYQQAVRFSRCFLERLGRGELS